MTSQATKIRREETGRPSWTSCCPVWGTPWGWETSGDSRTCVTETEEVKFNIFDEDLSEQQSFQNLTDCLNYISFALLFSGAFFIPYCIALAFLGIPIFLLELAIGQYSSAGPFTCWKYSPIFTGKFIDKHISMI